jgi:hypothetical protein
MRRDGIVAPLEENSVKHLSQQTVLDEVKEIIHLLLLLGRQERPR